MKTFRKESRYVTRIVALISSPIGAIEMMRYDSCHPESEEDSHKLEAMINHHAEKTTDHLVRFIRVARNSDPPTTRRWRSYNCTVLAVQHPNDPRPNDAEMLAMHEAVLKKPKNPKT